MPKHFNIRVTGMVQGVFFRASTRNQAISLGIKGYVRNDQDGSVYIEAEGDEDILETFVDWCRHGPTSARVEGCEVVEGRWQDFKDFSIERH